MIFDDTLIIAKDTAHGTDGDAIDLGVALPYGVGAGEPVRLTIVGSTDLAACTGIIVNTGPADTTANVLAEYTFNPAGVVREIILPSNVDRYINVELVGTTTAGTWTCGITPEGTQTNL